VNHKNYSKKSRKVKEGSFDDFDSPDSNITANVENINTGAWRKFIAYYRYYMDEFAINVLGLNLYPFQRVILRAMGRNQFSMFIACRGLGKSWLTAVFFICSAILYPNIKCGVASGNFRQAKNVIVQKIQGELAKNENIKREIQFPIKVTGDECCVTFKNGSEIRAISVDQRTGGDGARSWRFNYLIIDEARLVKDSIIEEILIPMTKTKREVAIKQGVSEKGKIIYITSAYLKISPLYSRFKHHYEQMVKGDEKYYVCALPYQVGVSAGIFDEDDITSELDKPSMTTDRYTYEYLGQFVGSSNESYYPYEITAPCRTSIRGELEQPKKTTAKYIITHDVALSDARGADNACSHVIKLTQKANGSLKKSIVYTKVVGGMTLPEQRDFLRELLHIKFPNTVKLVLDTRGSGEALPSLFYESWEYISPKGERTEYPPIVKDDDEIGMKMDDAMPIIRCVTATNEFHIRFYPYLKSCLQDKSLEILSSSDEVDIEWKEGNILDAEYAIHKEHDALVSELNNIKEKMTEHNNTVYERIVKTRKRDRATSLVYGLSVIYEYEVESKEQLYGKKTSEYEYRCLYN